MSAPLNAYSAPWFGLVARAVVLRTEGADVLAALEALMATQPVESIQAAGALCRDHELLVTSAMLDRLCLARTLPAGTPQSKKRL